MPEDPKGNTEVIEKGTTEETTEEKLFDKTPKEEVKEETKEEVKSEEETKAETKDEKSTSEEESAKPETKPEKIVPEKYDLKLPDGSLLSDSAIDRISEKAKADKLSNDEAQIELNKEHESVNNYVEGEKAKLAQRAEQWVDDIKKDSEIGGDAFKENVALAGRVLDKFGPPELKEALNKTGLGDHPALVKFFVRVGKQFSEDKLVVPGSQPKAKKSTEELFYGDNKT